MNTHTLTPETRLHISMSHGQWVPQKLLLRRCAKYFTREEDLFAALERGVSEGEYLKGTHNGTTSYRMTLKPVLYWNNYRTENAPPGKKDAAWTKPRIFGGILEDDGWEQAPLRTFDIVHFPGGIDTANTIRNMVGYRGTVLYDFERTIRINTLVGEDIRNELAQLAITNPELDISLVRLDKGVRRRELTDLPPAYLRDFFEFYTRYARNAVAKKGVLARHTDSTATTNSQIDMWIIEAIQRYENTTNIPFAAYLSTVINRWIHDLPRQKFGRSLADMEIASGRAQIALRAELNREPTEHEIANHIGIPISEYRQKMGFIAAAKNISAPTQIDAETDSTPDHTLDSEAPVEKDQSQALLSMALTTSALEHSRGPQIVGWLNIYERTWGEKQKTRKAYGDTEKAIFRDMRDRLESTHS